jgi:hypothetical protein
MLVLSKSLLINTARGVQVASLFHNKQVLCKHLMLRRKLSLTAQRKGWYQMPGDWKVAIGVVELTQV